MMSEAEQQAQQAAQAETTESSSLLESAIAATKQHNENTENQKLIEEKHGR